MVEIKSFPAKNGDAFLVKATNGPFTMLVDCGYGETFQQHVRAELEGLAASGHALDLVVATHIDADHISGLLPFFRQNGQAEESVIIPVREVLHNSLRSLVVSAKGLLAYGADDAALLKEIRQRGYPPPVSTTDRQQEISARQGSSLAELLRKGGYRWNRDDGTLSVGGYGLAELHLPGARINIIGPSQLRLAVLKKWWISEIRRLGLVGPLGELDDVFEFLCSNEVIDPGVHLLAASGGDLAQVYFPDDSVTNGSSIAFVAEVEACRLLFLGDACAEDMVTALKQNGPTIFNAIKVAHHGSARNTSPELLTLIDSPHFFISTNGEGHQHPDFAVLKAIVDRPAAFRRTLHFNYSTEASRSLKTYRSKSGAAFLVVENQTDWVAINGQNSI